jgi:sigma-B regulation protein RsbU (phosphoserine phosphatase)
VLLPFTVLPGIGWSWWRYSRFRRNFRSVFESKQLRQLTYELSGARRIHESSLPPVVDTGPVRLSYIYEPMSQIGGDVLYVHPRPPENPTVTSQAGEGFCQPLRQTVVLLDVTGHGIAAALTVNRLVGELERIFAERPDIGAGELMDTLNKYVYLTLATHGIFVTGLVLRGDMTQYEDRAACYREPLEIGFASAGHPTAFVRARDGSIERLESNATMLGVLPPEAFASDEQIFFMHPGDAVVAYTDGALEARNLDDEMIGIEGVRELVSSIGQTSADPSRWPEQLIRRVAAWRNAPPADDTLIACIYRPPVPAEMMGNVDDAPPHDLREPALVA